MGNTETRADCEGPSQGIANSHSLGNLLKSEHNSCTESSKYEMCKERYDLGSDIGSKQETLHIGEWHDRKWVENEKNPDALVEFTKSVH